MNLLAIIFIFMFVAQQVASEQLLATGLLATICDDEDYYVTHQSNIMVLHKTLQALHGTKLTKDLIRHEECIKRIEEPINDLVSIIFDREHHVCGQTRVSKMLKFHWKYVVSSLTSDWKQSMRGSLVSIPRSLIVVFINYAKRVTNFCSETLHSRVSHIDEITKKSIDDVFKSSLGASLDAAKSMLVPYEKIKKFDSFLLLWDALVHKFRRSGEMSIDEVDEYGDNIFSMIKTPNAREVWRLQDICRYRLRPRYQETVLSIMRLFDMGYGFEHKHISNSYGSSLKYFKNIRIWYSMAQVCELILSVEFLYDPTLKSAQVLKPEQQAEALSLQRHQFTPRNQIKSPELKQEKEVISNCQGLWEDSRMIKDTLARNIKSRAAILRRMLKNLFKLALRHPKTIFKNMFATVKSKFDKKHNKQTEIEHIVEMHLIEETEKLLDDYEDPTANSYVNLKVGQQLMEAKQLISSIFYTVITLSIVVIINGVLRVAEKVSG